MSDLGLQTRRLLIQAETAAYSALCERGTKRRRVGIARCALIVGAAKHCAREAHPLGFASVAIQKSVDLILESMTEENSAKHLALTEALHRVLQEYGKTEYLEPKETS